MDPSIAVIKQKAQVNLMKKQQVCTDSILADFNYTFAMPIDSSQVKKSKEAVLSHNGAIESRDAIQRDVRAPQIVFTFDLQTDVHANNADPKQRATIDQQAKIAFDKTQLQGMFEELEKVQLKLDSLNN